MIKQLFIFWDSGFNNAPFAVKKCLLSWKLKNQSWTIIVLDQSTIKRYINIKKEIPKIETKIIPKAAYSDIIRICLLEKYGGLWCDATTFCVKSLDNWLEKHIQTGFFAFRNPGKDRLLSSWFLYGEKDNYIIKKWKEKTIDFWNTHDTIDMYFWFHYLFNDLYKTDTKIQKIWNSVPKCPAKDPHRIRGILVKPLNQNVKKHIDNKVAPLYKLTYKYNIEKYNNKCNMAYLFKKLNLKFIHIPKTTDTSIEIAAMEHNIKWGKGDKTLKSTNLVVPWHTPQKVNCYSFCVIRDPFDRWISLFYHKHNTNDYNKKKLNVFINKKLQQINQNIHIENNHYLEQFKFFRHCKIAISFENLQVHLNTLTTLFNLPNITLKCNNNNFTRLTLQDINNENKTKILQFYKKDFELWNNVKKLGIIFI